ncbi:MAG: MBL fold metallo-hydrolase [Firmicutes bacterium]|nr:MBL fold metallo-hydrolase [Bacillota bacterium]
MNIRYLAHNCFHITSAKGSVVITDPYATSIPYSFPMITADIVLVSHEHRDHNAYWRVGGNPYVVKRTGEHPTEHEVAVKRVGEVFIFRGIPTFHDNFHGTKRGPNTSFCWIMDDLKICHLGDIGHLLTDQHLASMGSVDILFIPTGGLITIDPKEAALAVNQIRPKIVFPMHYKTPVIDNLGLANEPLQAFTDRMEDVENISSLAVEIFKDTLPSRTKTIVLKYE